MAISPLLPTTLSLSSLPPSSISARSDNNNIRQVSFSPIAYPILSHSNPPTVPFAKSSNYNVQILVEEDEPDDTLVIRFRREVIKAGIFQECKRKRFFENPIDKAKRKHREAAQRNRRRKLYFRNLVADKSDTPNNEKVDDVEEEDNWNLSDVDLPYT